MSHRSSTAAARIEPLEHRRMLASTISGVAYHDVNGNGVRDVNEVGMKNQTVYLDLNFNGTYQNNEPKLVTDSLGRYSFNNVGAGVWRLAVLAPKGYRQTSPAAKSFSIVATGFDVHAGNDFGFNSTGIIRGKVFQDTNEDGIQQGSEQNIVNAVVYIDKNNNGKLDSGEKARKTTANGTWRFTDLQPATYTVRVVVPTGRELTTPSKGLFSVKLLRAKTVSNLNFGLV